MGKVMQRGLELSNVQWDKAGAVPAGQVPLCDSERFADTDKQTLTLDL